MASRYTHPVAWDGEQILRYPTVFYFSPTTDPQVVAELGSFISQLKISGFIDEAYRSSRKSVATSSESYEQLDVTQYYGVYLIMGFCYVLAILARCLRRRKFNAKIREATRKKVGRVDLHAPAPKPELEV